MKFALDLLKGAAFTAASVILLIPLTLSIAAIAPFCLACESNGGPPGPPFSSIDCLARKE